MDNHNQSHNSTSNNFLSPHPIVVHHHWSMGIAHLVHNVVVPVVSMCDTVAMPFRMAQHQSYHIWYDPMIAWPLHTAGSRHNS